MAALVKANIISCRSIRSDCRRATVNDTIIVTPITLPNMATWTPERILEWAAGNLSPARLSCSFAGESTILVHMLAEVAPDIEIFTIDTGRLPEATHQLIDTIRSRYGVRIRVLTPDSRLVEQFATEGGPFSFMKSIENRLECCRIRKVEPLVRALHGAQAWITGVRRDEGIDRAEANIAEWDSTHNVVKLNPLAQWTTDEVWDYIMAEGVPYNRLYDEGYTSIGCEPCTRPTAAGENARAGRWWWEDSHYKECGIHVQIRTPRNI